MAEVALIDTIAKSAASAHTRLKCIWISPLPPCISDVVVEHYA
jgi:hypothetical protein